MDESILVQILNKPYRFRVPQGENELFEKAKTLLEQRVSQYTSVLTDKEALLTVVCMQFVVEKLKSDEQLAKLTGALEELNNEIDSSLAR